MRCSRSRSFGSKRIKHLKKRRREEERERYYNEMRPPSAGPAEKVYGEREGRCRCVGAEQARTNLPKGSKRL